MEEVKTDLLVDIDDGPVTKVTDLPLNLKSTGSTGNMTASLSTPGSLLYTSGASEGIQTSAKTKSRLSSIFQNRPTILNDDDPFNLPVRSKIENNYNDRNNSENRKREKDVRTGILVSIGENSNDDVFDGTSTDWDSLKFEANAIIGDIQLSSKKPKPTKSVFHERKKVNFLSPICGDKFGSSILNFSDSDDNSEDVVFNNGNKSHDFKRKGRDDTNETLSPISSPVKLLDFSGIDVSSIDAEKTGLDHLNISMNDITNRFSLVDLKQEEFCDQWNIKKCKETILDMQHLPDLEINTHQKILDAVKKNPNNTERKVLKFNESIRRHSYMPKSGLVDHYATPARTSKTVFKKPTEPRPLNSASTKQTNTTTKRVPLATTYQNNTNLTARVFKESTNNSTKFLKSRRQSHLPTSGAANHFTTPTRPSYTNTKKFVSLPKTSTAIKPKSYNTNKSPLSNVAEKPDKEEFLKQNKLKSYGQPDTHAKALNKEKQDKILDHKSRPHSYIKTRSVLKNAKDVHQAPKQVKDMNANKAKMPMPAGQKILQNRKAGQDQKKMSPSLEGNVIQSSTYTLTDVIAEYNSRGKIFTIQF